MRRIVSEYEKKRTEERRSMLEEARAKAEVELVDGREFMLLRLPDGYVRDEDAEARPHIALRNRRAVSRA